MTIPRSFKRYRRVRLKKESRTIRYPGVGKGQPGQGGNLYKCWYCGFICDDKRDPVDDGSSRWTVTYENAIDVASGFEISKAMMGGMDEYLLLPKAQSNGDPRVVAHTFNPTGGGGCPNCHIPNWRGDY